MRFRSALALVVWFALGASSLFAASATALRVVVNGTALRFDQPPVERGGRIYVPLRALFEQLGASVVAKGTAIDARTPTKRIVLRIGTPAASVNGVPTALDSPPFEIGGRTLVPLRFVSQALGATVSFDSAARTVFVTQPVAGAVP
ncbi:MAG: copper amine oxidase N-terminal domain-containing protein, partial [Vulcanimicrobiaceae bacterium]